jgi:hypothetical protein
VSVAPNNQSNERFTGATMRLSKVWLTAWTVSVLTAGVSVGEPELIDERLVTRITSQRIETRMYAKHHET